MQASDSNGQFWYAITVKPQHEKAVALAFQNRGWEQFLPLYRSRRLWSDRIMVLDLPLFPGYVFLRFGCHERTSVLRTPGVNAIVSFGAQPAAVDESELDSVRKLVASELPLSPWPFARVGQRVRIEGGPLAGAEGVVLRIKDSLRLVVSMSLLQRSVAVEIDPALVRVIRGDAVRRAVAVAGR